MFTFPLYIFYTYFYHFIIRIFYTYFTHSFYTYFSHPAYYQAPTLSFTFLFRFTFPLFFCTCFSHPTHYQTPTLRFIISRAFLLVVFVTYHYSFFFKLFAPRRPAPSPGRLRAHGRCVGECLVMLLYIRWLELFNTLRTGMRIKYYYLSHWQRCTYH